MALRASQQVILSPLQPCKLFGKDPVSFGLGRLKLYLTRMIFAHLALHLLQAFASKSFAADVPAAAKLLQRFGVYVLQATTFKLSSSGWRVCMDSVLAKQTCEPITLSTLMTLSFTSPVSHRMKTTQNFALQTMSERWN